MPTSEFFAQFQLRFTNWIRWCTENTAEPNSPCNSIEGRYKSPQIWDEVRPNMGLLNPINKWDAMILQRAYVAMPDAERRVCPLRRGLAAFGQASSVSRFNPLGELT